MNLHCAPGAGMAVLLLLDCGSPRAVRGPCTPGTTLAPSCADGSPGAPTDAGAASPDGGDGGSAATDGGPAPTFTFINQYLIQGESCGNCHGQNAPPGEASLDLVTDPYSALVGVPAVNLNGTVHEQADGGPLLRVSPGDPAESLLYIKLGLASASSQWGQPMPMSGPQSTPAFLMAALRAWIAAGAPDN